MKGYVVIAICAAVVVAGLIFLLRRGFVILLGYLFVIALFLGIMFFVYKGVFPPGWKNQ